MNPNQPPNYPQGQYPPQYPPMYPGMGQAMGQAMGQVPQQPQQQQQHQYMPQGTPQYPQPTGAVPQNYMNVQNSSVKQEPHWGGPEPTQQQQPQQPQQPQQQQPQQQRYNYNPNAAAQYGQMSGMQMMGRPDDSYSFSMAPSPMLYSTYLMQQQQQQQQQMAPASNPNPANSLLAQHLAAAPTIPQSSQQHQQQQQQQPVTQQPSQLHQLLQQPVYPPAGTLSRQPSFQQQQQEQMMAAEQQRQMQLQAQWRQHQQQQAQQQAQQQVQQSYQQQLQQQQQESVAQQQLQQQKTAYMAADQPNSQAFPPSVAASSTHSAYPGNQYQDPASAQMMLQHASSRPDPQTVDDFKKMTTGELCILGRELVTDLNAKTSQLSQMLKKVMERKQLNPGESPNDLSDQCRGNLEKMSEIRQIIEKRRSPDWKRLTGNDYLTLMLEDAELDEEALARRTAIEKRMPAIMSKTPPNEGDVWYQGRWIPEELHAKYVTFESNKEKLKNLANQLKTLQWKVEVTSPTHLKKVDQTKISKKREDPA